MWQFSTTNVLRYGLLVVCSELNTRTVIPSSLPSGTSSSPSGMIERNVVNCTSCGSNDVRRSHSRHLFDGVARTLGFKPYRCRSCRSRFFAK